MIVQNLRITPSSAPILDQQAIVEGKGTQISTEAFAIAIGALAVIMPPQLRSHTLEQMMIAHDDSPIARMDPTFVNLALALAGYIQAHPDIPLFPEPPQP